MADELMLERNNLGTVATKRADQARAEADLEALVHTMPERDVGPWSDTSLAAEDVWHLQDGQVTEKREKILHL
jgi:hypothetical protein